MEKKKTVRREISSLITEKEIFPTRLRDIMSERHVTSKMLAEYLGVSSTMVNHYRLGQSFPKTDRLMKIAEYFHVTVNYLFGFSDADTDDEDITPICDYTGLSPEAVRILHNATIDLNQTNQDELSATEVYFALVCQRELNDFINDVVANKFGPNFIRSLSSIKDVIIECQKSIEQCSSFISEHPGNTQDDNSYTLKDYRRDSSEILVKIDQVIKELRYQIYYVQDCLKDFMDETFHIKDIDTSLHDSLGKLYDHTMKREAAALNNAAQDEKTSDVLKEKEDDQNAVNQKDDNTDR